MTASLLSVCAQFVSRALFNARKIVMKAQATLQIWFPCISDLYPPMGLVHIGAGYGPSVVHYADWEIPQALLIDADPKACVQLGKQFASKTNWQIKDRFVAPNPGEARFFSASNSAESSALLPEQTAQLWQHLKFTENAELTAASLATLLKETFDDEGMPNWLIFGCFEAKAMLASTPSVLESVDFICARVIIDEKLTALSNSNLQTLKEYLENCGYLCVGVEEERNPAIGHAIFVRNYKNAALAAQSKFEQTAKLAAERQTQIEQLTQAKGEADKLAAERAQQLTQANQAKDVQAKLAAERQTQIEQLTQAKGEADKLAAERAQQLTQANQAKDVQAKLAAERQTQIEQLTQAKGEADKLAAERAQQLLKEVEMATKAMKEQATLAKESISSQQRLEQANLELEARQHRMNDELLRAEAQINLIKDLLLRESGL
jgi:DNA repair exonuclease SbcCD ATPase subunit